MELNTTEPEDFGSGSGLGLMMNETNGTNGTVFSCLNRDMLSSTMVTNESFWRIQESLRGGAPAVATIYFIFFGISFFWNLFIVVTYLVKYRLLKEPANIFLFTLAVFDLVASVVMTLFSFIIEATTEYIFGNDDVTRCNTCDMVGFFFVFLVAGSLHLLTALSIDRFIHLSRPLRYNKIMNHWKALVIVVFVIILSFIFAILPIAPGFGQYEFNTRFGICIARFGGNSRLGVPNLAFFTVLIVEALIPIAILCVTNVFTIRIVKKFLKRNFRRRSTYRHKREEQTEDAKKHSQQQNQLVKVFGALFIAYAISWSLIVTVVLVVNFVPARLVPDEIFIFGWICYLTNPLLHPIIESFFVKDLRLVINRAKKEVRRAGTLVIRQSSKFLSRGGNGKASALDEALERINREEKAAAAASSVFNSSVVSSSAATEAFEMSDVGGMSPMLANRVIQDGENGDIDRPKSLSRAGRSVTFSEEEAGAFVPNGEPRKTGSVLKKRDGKKRVQGALITDSIVEESEEVIDASKTEDAVNGTLETVEEVTVEEVVAESEGDKEGVTDSNGVAGENGTAPVVTTID